MPKPKCTCGHVYVNHIGKHLGCAYVLCDCEKYTPVKRVVITFAVDIDIQAFMNEYDIPTVREAIHTLKVDAKNDVQQWLESRGFSAKSKER